MTKEDKKLQKHLVEEMMKVSKTNPDVMYYMESLMEYCLKIEKENNKYKEVIDKIKEKCLSIKGNPEHTIVSKNELVKQFLEILEEIE